MRVRRGAAPAASGSGSSARPASTASGARARGSEAVRGLRLRRAALLRGYTRLRHGRRESDEEGEAQDEPVRVCRVAQPLERRPSAGAQRQRRRWHSLAAVAAGHVSQRHRGGHGSCGDAPARARPLPRRSEATAARTRRDERTQPAQREGAQVCAAPRHQAAAVLLRPPRVPEGGERVPTRCQVARETEASTPSRFVQGVALRMSHNAPRAVVQNDHGRAAHHGVECVPRAVRCASPVD